MFCESRVLSYSISIHLVSYKMPEVWKTLLNERSNIEMSEWVKDLFKSMEDQQFFRKRCFWLLKPPCKRMRLYIERIQSLLLCYFNNSELESPNFFPCQYSQSQLWGGAVDAKVSRWVQWSWKECEHLRSAAWFSPRKLCIQSRQWVLVLMDSIHQSNKGGCVSSGSARVHKNSTSCSVNALRYECIEALKTGWLLPLGQSWIGCFY